VTVLYLLNLAGEDG